MDISSTSNSSYSRSVTPSNGSRDRPTNDESKMVIAEAKTQERAQQQKAVQERLQHSREENERRLDGRLISFGYEHNDADSQEQQVSFNRNRVNDAYSPPVQNERTSSQEQHDQQRSSGTDDDAIDIIV